MFPGRFVRLNGDTIIAIVEEPSTAVIHMGLQHSIRARQDARSNEQVVRRWREELVARSQGARK